MEKNQSSSRAHNIISHLEKLWQYPKELTPDNLRQITEFILSLPQPYREIGFKKIAEYTISGMNLHILNIMTKFQLKAQEEGISLEEVKKTFEHINPETFQVLNTVSQYTSISSLDNLATLSNIVISLQTLSEANSADEAQSWLFELPQLYYEQLAQENLINPTMEKSKNTWINRNATQSYVLLGTGDMNISLENASRPASLKVKVNLDPQAA